MKRMLARITLTTLLALGTAAWAQQPAPACPAHDELGAVHLYGAWRAQWPAEPDRPEARLQLERHPELGDSVRGQLTRDGLTAQVAGDVDHGDFTLEESLDGRRISANWIGRFVDGSCAKEIRGVWTDADTDTQRDFVLRRQGGWQ